MKLEESILRELTVDPCYTVRCWAENGGAVVRLRLEYNSGRGTPVGPISLEVPTEPLSFSVHWTEYTLTKKDIDEMNSRDVAEETLAIIIGQMMAVVDEDRGVQPSPTGD